MKTSSVVRYLEAYRMRAFAGSTVVPRLLRDIKAEPWLVSSISQHRHAACAVGSHDVRQPGVGRLPVQIFQVDQA